MNEKLEILKKKLLYRASYRGTKEMDILLSTFVKKHINKLNVKQLIELEDFLKFEDLFRLIPTFLFCRPEVVNVSHINCHEEESLLSVKNHPSPNCG